MAESVFHRLDAAVDEIRTYTRGRARVGVTHDNADEVDGTIASDSAIQFDPRQLLSELFATGADLLLIGQVAGILHGSQELTGDLDLVWRRDERFAGELAAVFRRAAASFRDRDDQRIAITAGSLMQTKVNFTTARVSGDLCTPELWGADLPVDGYFDRAEIGTLRGVNIQYLNVMDLIDMRALSGRPKDLRRNAELEAIGAAQDPTS